MKSRHLRPLTSAPSAVLRLFSASLARSAPLLLPLLLSPLSLLCFFEAIPPEAGADEQPHPLFEAHRLAQSGDDAAACRAFDRAAGVAELRAWALIGVARCEQRAGRVEEARGKLRDFPAASPAALDARVLRFLLEPDAGGSDLAELKEAARKTKRTDLLAQLLFAEANGSMSLGNADDTFRIYRELRPILFRPSPLGLWKLPGPIEPLFLAMLGKLVEPARSHALLFEAEQLFVERRLDDVLERLHARAPNSQEDSQAKILEAKSLRMLGRSEEAEALLGRAVKRHGAQGAKLELLELSRMRWNRNELSAARESAALFLKSHPKSPEAQEMEHLHAASWLDEQKWDRGERELELLSARSPQTEYPALSQRDLAWISFRRGNIARSAEWFSRYRSSMLKRIDRASSSSGAERSKNLRDARFELEHATFWLAETCERLGSHAPAQWCGAPNTPQSAQTLRRALASGSPLHYYAMLAADREKRPFPPAELVPARSFRMENFCPGLSKEREQTFVALQREELPALTEIEALSESQKQWEGNEGKRALCSAALLSRFGAHSSALQLLTALLRDADAEGKGLHSLPVADDPLLIPGLFPLPYRSLFEQEGRQRKVPLPFSLAISRTESLFDPSARSTSDARGLMQLLPKTAVSEGLDDPAKLFDPASNIAVGTKHLSGLLALYEGDEDLAAGAYNGGRTAVDSWRERRTKSAPKPPRDIERMGKDAWIETIPYSETRNYIKKVRLARRWYAALTTAAQEPSPKK